jgi:hypothetical protein
MPFADTRFEERRASLPGRPMPARGRRDDATERAARRTVRGCGKVEGDHRLTHKAQGSPFGDGRDLLRGRTGQFVGRDVQPRESTM